MPYKQLLNYRTVARAYESSARTELSWTHHERLASHDDRLSWLAQAEANKWSARQMLTEIAVRKTPELPDALEAAIGALRTWQDEIERTTAARVAELTDMLDERHVPRLALEVTKLAAQRKLATLVLAEALARRGWMPGGDDQILADFWAGNGEMEDKDINVFDLSDMREVWGSTEQMQQELEAVWRELPLVRRTGEGQL